MRVYPYKLSDNALKTPYKEIWEIGCSTGLRVSDIISLTVGQIRTEKPTIREQKTGKSKRIYIPKKTREKLIEKTRHKKDDEFVFSSNSKSGHITRQAVFKAFKKASANININVGTHTMRKNYAIKMACKGKGLQYVQKKLNHNNIAETLLYLQKKEIKQ